MKNRRRRKRKILKKFQHKKYRDKISRRTRRIVMRKMKVRKRIKI